MGEISVSFFGGFLFIYFSHPFSFPPRQRIMKPEMAVEKLMCVLCSAQPITPLLSFQTTLRLDDGNHVFFSPLFQRPQPQHTYIRSEHTPLPLRPSLCRATAKWGRVLDACTSDEE